MVVELIQTRNRWNTSSAPVVRENTATITKQKVTLNFLGTFAPTSPL